MIKSRENVYYLWYQIRQWLLNYIVHFLVLMSFGDFCVLLSTLVLSKFYDWSNNECKLMNGRNTNEWKE